MTYNMFEIFIEDCSQWSMRYTVKDQFLNALIQAKAVNKTRIYDYSFRINDPARSNFLTGM